MERPTFRAVSLPWLMKEIRAARPRDAKAALAPAETRAATLLWTVPRQPSDFGRRRVSGAETWNDSLAVPDPPDVPVRSRAQSVFSDVDLERVRRQRIRPARILTRFSNRAGPMVQDHWPVGSEPQFVTTTTTTTTTLSYSWTQSHGGDSAVDRGWRRCPNR